MAQIRGVLLNAWFTFFKLRYGDLAVTAALDALGPDDRRILSTPFLASSWYPYDMVSVLRRMTKELAGTGDRNLSGEIGRFMAQYTFTGIYNSLLAADPIKQVEKAAWMEGFFLSGAGSVDTEILGPTSCAMKFTYESEMTPARSICENLKGFWLSMIELSGGRDVSGEHTACVLEGADSCEFRFDWTI